MRHKRKKPLPRGKLRDNSKSISVRMTEEISSLDEVQVIAYGQQSKRDMVGAMSVVKSKDLLPQAHCRERDRGKTQPDQVSAPRGSQQDRLQYPPDFAESPRKGTGPGGGGQNPFPAGTHSRTGLPHKRTP